MCYAFAPALVRSFTRADNDLRAENPNAAQSALVSTSENHRERERVLFQARTPVTVRPCVRSRWNR